MTRSISRDSFNEQKQYVGVHLQQGRAILDADWNEGQDIMASLARRLGQDAFRDGIIGEGFEIQPVLPTPFPFLIHRTSHAQGGLPHLFKFPSAQPFDPLDTIDGWALAGGAAGKLRISRDRPYEGKTFLRLSDHGGQVQVTKTLANIVDLSAFQFAHFRYRLNQTFPTTAAAPGTASFFIEDINGNRNVWTMTGLWNAKDLWAPAAAIPLDLRFQIVDLDLLSGVVGQPYNSILVSFGAPSTSITWAVIGTLPPGISLVPQSGTPYARLSGTPTSPGAASITVSATSGGATVSRSFQVDVQTTPVYSQLSNTAAASTISDDVQSIWDSFLRPRATKPTGTAADLSKIKKYGFDVFQQTSPALIWDFDALQVASRNSIKQAASNNFVISGPLQKRLIDYLQAASAMRDIPLGPDLIAYLATLSKTSRAYAGGLASAVTRDVLYSEQADPSDPPLTTPTGSAVRKDLVYLDVWREPVTYVEDPELREIALGGPDSATRMRIRQRVRVAQNGTLPTGDGTGQGTLATEGSYTDRSNRLYLVEVDTPGNIGTATVRWSEDNGSTIQRVIEAIPAISTKVKVEDASAFQPGDFILIRKEFTDEEHRISNILGNTITLAEPTGSSTFALTDRPKVQRWNGFHAPIVTDSVDPTISAPVSLSFGVKVRFGGSSLKKGDFWTFRTRYLAGDDASGINASARIETVDFQSPQGVIHQYSPLALLLRDPNIHDADRIKMVRDQRTHAGHIVSYSGDFNVLVFTGLNVALPFGGVHLGLTSARSTFLCFWSGTMTADVAGTVLRLEVVFFNNDMTNPDIYPDNSVTGFQRSAQTTIVCESTSQRFRTPLLVQADWGNMFNPRADMVEARAFFTVLSGAGVSLSGQLEIIEIKNRLFKPTDFQLSGF